MEGIRKVTEKPVAASASLADHILIVINGKLYRAAVETLSDTLTQGQLQEIRAAKEQLERDLTEATGEAETARDSLEGKLQAGNDLNAALGEKISNAVAMGLDSSVAGNTHVYDIGSAAFDIATLDFSTYDAGDVILVVSDMEGA